MESVCMGSVWGFPFESLPITIKSIGYIFHADFHALFHALDHAPLCMYCKCVKSFFLYTWFADLAGMPGALVTNSLVQLFRRSRLHARSGSTHRGGRSRYPPVMETALDAYNALAAGRFLLLLIF
jgi:hypothetical protein